jgi:hypothetical protein
VLSFGGSGNACAGGGYVGAGVLVDSTGTTGMIEVSVTVDKDVPAVVGFEPIELFHVLPENPLESDSRGKADFD